MDKRISLEHGTIRYRELGNLDGPPLLFVHGLLVDGRLWNEVLAPLEGSHRLIVPDLPLGSHREPLNAGADRSPRGVAHLLADMIEQLELDGVTVVANDTGGAISQILAAERRQRLAALVLTNCDCFENFPPPILRPLQWLAHVPGAWWLLAQTMRSSRVRRSPLAFGMLSHATIADELTAGWGQPPRDAAIRSDLVAVLKAIDSRDTVAAAERLAAHPLPLLLAWAPDDRMFPLRFAQRLADAVPGAQLELIEHSRAFVPIDQPRRLAELIERFCAGIERREPAVGS